MRSDGMRRENLKKRTWYGIGANTARHDYWHTMPARENPSMLSSFDHCHDVVSKVFGSQQQEWRISENVLNLEG
jgi:hypothetical protein